MTGAYSRVGGTVVFLLTCLLRGMTLCGLPVKKLWGFYSHASCEA